MKRFLVVITAIFFVLVLVLDSAIFNFMLSGPALVFTCIFSWSVVGILSFVIAAYYSRLNKKSGGDKKEDYITRIWGVLIVMVLFSFGVSFVGGILMFTVVTLTRNMVENFLLGGAIFPLLMFMVYLLGLYKNFIKLGFQDAQNQKFNLNFKMMTLILVLMFIAPMAIFGNAYATYYLQNGLFVDFRSFFSFNINLMLVDDYIRMETLTSVGMGTLIAKVFFTLVLEMAVAIFAYIRGKAIFVKQHLRKTDDYETDETFVLRREDTTIGINELKWELN